MLRVESHKENKNGIRLKAFCVFNESTNFKIRDVIIETTAYQGLHFRLFLLIPSQ